MSNTPDCACPDPVKGRDITVNGERGRQWACVRCRGIITAGVNDQPRAVEPPGEREHVVLEDVPAAATIRQLVDRGVIGACLGCGSDESITVETTPEKRQGRVRCGGCGLVTPYERRLRVAVERWNGNRGLYHEGPRPHASDFATRQARLDGGPVSAGAVPSIDHYDGHFNGDAPPEAG